MQHRSPCPRCSTRSGMRRSLPGPPGGSRVGRARAWDHAARPAAAACQHGVAEHHPGRVSERARAAAVDRGRGLRGRRRQRDHPGARRRCRARVPCEAQRAGAAATRRSPSTLVLLSVFDFLVATCLVIWAAVTGYLPGQASSGRRSTSAGRFHNPGTFLKVIAIVLVILLVIVLWFAEQIGDFRRRLAQGFSILKDKTRLPPSRRRLAGGGLAASVRSGALLPARVRIAGDRAQRPARPGLGSSRIPAPDQPFGDRHGAGFPAVSVQRASCQWGTRSPSASACGSHSSS